MTEEIRKRLEESVKDFRGCFLGRMNKYRELKGKEPYSADNVIMNISLDAAEIGYKAGAEHGYKEAIIQAKEWLMNYFVFDNTLMSASGCALFLKTFESDMNKLWEEQI